MKIQSRWILAASILAFASCSSISSKRPEFKRPPRKTVQKKNAEPKSTDRRVVTTPLTNPTLPNQTSNPLVPDKTKVEVLKEAYLKNPENVDKYKTELTTFTDGEIEEIISSGELGILRGHALFEKSKRFEDKGDLDSSIRTLDDIARMAPGSTLADEAQNRIREFRTLYAVNKDTIAALLPLSGRNAGQGQKALRALQMGLGITDQNSEFKLKIIDSEGTAEGAESALHKAVFQEHPIAVVGPIISRTATAVADECELYKVPCISLSQKSQVTLNKDYVFTHSLNSDRLTEFLVQKSFDMGMKKFAILYPDDAYGVEYANSFWDEVLLRGGQVTAIQAYEPNATDFKFVMQRLLSSFYIESRKDEYTLLTKDNKKTPISSRQNNSTDDILPPLVDFDAIFIPDSAKTMGQLSAFLTYSGVKKMTLIGTNLWNGPGLGKRAQSFKDSLYFADMYNPADTSNQALPFFKTYFEKFGEYPGPLEVHAYESGLVLRQALLRRIPNRQVMQSYLSNLKSFPGVFGQLNMNDRHQLERPLSLFKIDKEDIAVVQ